MPEDEDSELSDPLNASGKTPELSLYEVVREIQIS